MTKEELLAHLDNYLSTHTLLIANKTDDGLILTEDDLIKYVKWHIQSYGYKATCYKFKVSQDTLANAVGRKTRRISKKLVEGLGFTIVFRKNS